MWAREEILEEKNLKVVSGYITALHVPMYSPNPVVTELKSKLVSLVSRHDINP